LVILFLVFAIVLAFVAYKTDDRTVRIFCTIICLANLAGAAKAIYTNDEYAYKLRPNDGAYDPDYRPDRR
jgi:hypothetical protein